MVESNLAHPRKPYLLRTWGRSVDHTSSDTLQCIVDDASHSSCMPCLSYFCVHFGG